MIMSYTHLTQKEIYAIEFSLSQWFNEYNIANKLWRSPSTITREIERYCNPKTWKYNAEFAIQQRRKIKEKVNSNNKTRLKSWRDDSLINYILSKIKLHYWSPEQISWNLRVEKWIVISKDTIYNFIYTHHRELVKYFRRKWRKYIHNRRNICQLPNRTMIDERPSIVDRRERIWDWEWDLIVWPVWSKKALITYVERKSWYLQSRILDWKNSEKVLKSTIKIFSNIKRNKKHTITYDNWGEFKEHLKIEEKTKMKVYFAHPYHSWERWTNENTNWLLRQFFPKWTDFWNITKNKLQYYVNLINSRPRKRLNYDSPKSVFFHH